MLPYIHQLTASEPRHAPFMNDLASCFKAMDQLFDRTARAYGFVCRGCEDNCCSTRFYHHTHVEFAYLINGLKQLDDSLLLKIRAKSELGVDHPKTGPEKDPVARKMCPLNGQGRCLVYDHRPMICRLHGLPSELVRPGAETVCSPGCDDFMRQCGGNAYVPFDRTPFYRETAGIEQAFKVAFRYDRKFKMTIGEMTACFFLHGKA